MPMFTFTEYRENRQRNKETQTSSADSTVPLSPTGGPLAAAEQPLHSGHRRDGSAAPFRTPAMIYRVRHGLRILRLPSSIWFVTEVKQRGNIQSSHVRVKSKGQNLVQYIYFLSLEKEFQFERGRSKEAEGVLVNMWYQSYMPIFSCAYQRGFQLSAHSFFMYQPPHY